MSRCAKIPCKGVRRWETWDVVVDSLSPIQVAAVLYHTIPYHVIPHHIIPYHTICSWFTLSYRRAKCKLLGLLSGVSSHTIPLPGHESWFLAKKCFAYWSLRVVPASYVWGLRSQPFGSCCPTVLVVDQLSWHWSWKLNLWKLLFRPLLTLLLALEGGHCQLDETEMKWMNKRGDDLCSALKAAQAVP